MTHRHMATGSGLRAPQRAGTNPVDWPSLGLSLLAVLVVSVPAMAWAEGGRVPMIDHHNDGWFLPAGIALVGFALGGAVAARRQGGAWRAAAHGLGAGVVCAGLLVLADVVRRAGVHKVFSVGVGWLWVNAAGASVGAAVVGALVWLGARRVLGVSSREPVSTPGIE